MADERTNICPNCGEAIGWAQVGKDRNVAISRVQALEFSKGLPGPTRTFNMPLTHEADRVQIHFVDGHDVMVRHAAVCGRRQRPESN